MGDVMAEHSKLPWRADGPDDFGDYNILNDDDSLAIAAVVSNMRPAECVAANAAFIVRAVNCHAELVEALEAIVNSDMALREEDEGRTSPELERARAVIAKARGGQP
jgi:hypothetical protein